MGTSRETAVRARCCPLASGAVVQAAPWWRRTHVYVLTRPNVMSARNHPSPPSHRLAAPMTPIVPIKRETVVLRAANTCWNPSAPEHKTARHATKKARFTAVAAMNPAMYAGPGLSAMDPGPRDDAPPMADICTGSARAAGACEEGDSRCERDSCGEIDPEGEPCMTTAMREDIHDRGCPCIP